MALRLVFTDDIPEPVRRELTEAWEPLGGLEGGEGRGVFQLSLDPPSWLQIIGEAASWFPLQAAATIFLSQIAKEAATDAYKNKSQIARALTQVTVEPLRRAAAAVGRARAHAPIALGLSVPDDYFGTAISVEQGASEQDIAYLMALLVLKADSISEFVQSEINAGRPPVGRVHLQLSENGGMLKLSWMARPHLTDQTKEL